MAGGTTLKNGLVIVYELDETTGNTAFDSFGSNDGVITNAIINQSGVIDKAYNLNYTGYITLPNIFSSYTNGSVSFWVYRNTSAQYQDVFFTGIGTTTYNYFAIQLDNGTFTDRVYLSIRSLSQHTLTAYSSTKLATSVWYHIVVTMSSSGLKMYINGASDTVNFYRGNQSTVSWMSAPTGTQEAFIGRVRYNGSYCVRADVKIDQFSVWDRALTTEEISTLYNSGNGLAYINW